MLQAGICLSHNIITSMLGKKKNPRQPIQQFLLNLKPVSRTAQKAEVLQKLPYKYKGLYTKAEQTNLLSFSTNTSEKSYTKLTKCFN